MEKIQNSNEEGIEQKKGLGEGEKAAILKGILNRKSKQEKAASTPKRKETLDLTVDVDVSRLYEAMSTFFNGMANVFNQFANGMNAASNNFKDEAIRILREKAEKEKSEN